MFYNIGFTYIMVIYCHYMVIAMVIWLYSTEGQYYHGMVVNYRGKKFCNIGPWWQKMAPEIRNVL